WLHRQKHICINHKTVLRLMNKMNIRSVARKRRIFRKMTELQHHYENLLHREFHASQPNQKWVTDVTYIATQQGWGYLSTIQDLFDGFIVSHHSGRQNSLGLVLNTLQQARHKEQVTGDLLLHSDHGYQYTSHAYALLNQHYAITPSMSRLC